MKNQKGFTLIELLIVIVIISILAAIIFVAIDPATRFGDARNARRRSEVVSILNAVLKYQVDNDGDLPTGIDATVGTSQVLGTAGAGCDTSCGAVGTEEAVCVDLSTPLVDEYLAAIPTDPNTGTAANTDYYINRTTSGRLLVGACDPENGAVISVTR
jgi:type IV pilus assembly protein PilA